MFNRFRVVVDVYLARKLNKEGKKFGFVRFNRVQDIRKLERERERERELSKIWNGNYKLFASVEKFRRKKVDVVYSKDDFILEEGFKQDGIWSNKKKSYVEAIKGSSGMVKNKTDEDSASLKSDMPQSKGFRISLESNENFEVVEYLKFVAKHLISEFEEIPADGKVVVIRITERECFMPPWESSASIEEEDKSECGDAEDGDLSMYLVEGEQDPLFMEISFEGAESRAKNSTFSKGIINMNSGMMASGSPEKSLAVKHLIKDMLEKKTWQKEFE
ncbi:hypothetical protein L6452_25590 [Arctium lappa]|uniref:Uncharacterized protein n=1 Tax=Arctium lappa TaxID=4217 RepID=A0ACB9AFN9_ARCLA|nr:hypothetical protein L6452_25590 [Arctium lappa]